MVDLLIRDEGSVVTFQPVTADGRRWIDENVISEPWQWLGGTLGVSWRSAAPIIEGAVGAGLEVSSGY